MNSVSVVATLDQEGHLIGTRTLPLAVSWILVLVWGALLSGVVLFGVFLVLAVVYIAGGHDAGTVHAIAWWLFVTGLGVGSGFTAAFLQRRRLNSEGLASVRRRPLRFGWLVLAGLAGMVVCDFVRCDLGLGMPNYGSWAREEWSAAHDRVDPRELDPETARAAMAEAIDGKEIRMRGWTFRTLASNRTLPEGPWYFAAPYACHFECRGMPTDTGTWGERFDFDIIVKPRSIGARLAALQFSESDRVGGPPPPEMEIRRIEVDVPPK